MSISHDFSEVVDGFLNREVNIKSGPAVIYIESVKGCPFSCIMCKTVPTKQQRISPELLQRIEPAFADLEVLAIHGYGEPLLADLDYLVGQSVKNDFVIHMDTNGFLLTDEMANLLLQTRLSIRFSVHAGRPETYYQIMGVDLAKVKQNIHNLVEKSKNSSKSQDFWFSYIVMKENLHEIEDFLRLTHECGIQSVRFMSLYPSLEMIKGVTLRGLKFKYSEQTGKNINREFFANLPHYKSLAAEIGIKIEWGDKENGKASLAKTVGGWANMLTRRVFHKPYFPLIPAKAGYCAAPWIGQIRIHQSGNVYLCCGSNYRLGNLNESSLDEIWHGPKMTKIRQAFRDGHYPRICGYCRGFGFDDYPNNSFQGIRRKYGNLPSTASTPQ